MHGGLSDMTILRFARKSTYGYFSALGMFIGHYGAWVCAGIMGAGAALLLGTSIRFLDAGEVAYQAMGFAGIVAVIIAGWTTSNPTIYRAGLAFQSLNPNWSRAKVTVITGIATTIIACFPFVFTKLLDFVGLMGLTLAPVGAIIVAEHWLFPRLGLTRYWSAYSGRNTNRAAIIAWLGSLLAAFLMSQAGLHLFFLLVPTWLCATLIYVFLARQQGATVPHTEAATRDAEQSKLRLANEEAFLERFNSLKIDAGAAKARGQTKTMGIFALASLVICIAMAIATYTGRLSLNDFRAMLIWPSLAYFVSATVWAIGREKADERLEQRGHGNVDS
jgi:NCS1 family nucleobase:cation symporter-1